MKFWFGLLVLFLMLINVLAIIYLDEFQDRWFRLFATGTLFVLFLIKFNREKKLLLAFVLLTICDGLIIYYENPIIRKVIYLTRILAYVLIIYFLYPQLSKLRLNAITIIVSTFIIGIDLYLVHDMALYIPTYTQDILFTILFYTLGLISLALVASSISYLNRYANKKGFLLVLISICFVLSDITFYNAYYLGFDIFYYADRIANIAGISSLVLFAGEWMKRNNHEVKTEI